MRRITDVKSAREYVYALRANGDRIGLVPTMGALHEGHISLVQLSQQKCDETIATIFVNPTQFGPNEDLDTYPRTLEQDCEKLAAAGASAVFLPSVEEMYPGAFSTFVAPPKIGESLEGTCRPGHFRGVTTVVMKLFQILPTTHAFFGRKDYQQWKVIQAMAEDLNVGVDVQAGDTIREPDGLALSSRNRYLTKEDRQRALLLSKALSSATQAISDGERSAEKLAKIMQGVLTDAGTSMSVDKIDYAAVVDAETLQAIVEVEKPAVALIAAYVGQTRLIDNAILQ